MANTTTDAEPKLPEWFSSMCDRLWKMQRAFWTLLGLGAIASLVAFLLTLQWPFATNKSLDGTFLGWCFHNSLLLLFIGLFYLACFGVVYIGHRYHRLALVHANFEHPEQLQRSRATSSKATTTLSPAYDSRYGEPDTKGRSRCCRKRSSG